MSANLDDLLAPALATYAAALDAHGHDAHGCRCGWTPKGTSQPRRATGLHIAAAERRASKAYRAEAFRLIEGRHTRAEVVR